MNDPRGLLSETRGIVIAADVLSVPALEHLVALSEGVPEVVAVKVGFSLTLRVGLRAVVDAVRSVRPLTVIYDHQKAGTDIPQMGRPFAEVCSEAGVEGVILFPQAGPRTLDAFVSAASECGLVPIVGLVMTHPGYLQSDGGFVVDSAPDIICKLALDMGVRSFVLPGNRPDIVARFSGGALMPVAPTEIMMPGIGAQGGAIAEAFGAAPRHHPFAIIGSAIYGAADPRAALQRFAAEIRA